MRRYFFDPPFDYWITSQLGRRLYELRFVVNREVRQRRRALGVSQAELARRLGTSQARVSKLERCCGHTTLDFAISALLALGATEQEIAAALDTRRDPLIAALRARADRITFVELKRKCLRKQVQTRELRCTRKPPPGE